MRCEICGCIGVSRELLPTGKREWRKIGLLLLTGVIPGIVFTMRCCGRPYCARCKHRVAGTGVSIRDGAPAQWPSLKEWKNRVVPVESKRIVRLVPHAVRSPEERRESPAGDRMVA